MYFLDMREHFWTERKKVSREFKYLKLPCPKFKRGRQMANVTAGVWLRDSEALAVTRNQKPTWIQNSLIIGIKLKI